VRLKVLGLIGGYLVGADGPATAKVARAKVRMLVKIMVSMSM
jgi:hypothetical protein